MFKKTPEWFLMFFLSGAKVGQIIRKGEFYSGFLVLIIVLFLPFRMFVVKKRGQDIK